MTRIEEMHEGPTVSLVRIPGIWDLLIAQGLPIAVQTFLGLSTAMLLGPAGKGIASLAIVIASLGGATAFLSIHIGVVHAVNHGDRRATVRGIAVVCLLAALPVLIGYLSGIGSIGAGSSERQRSVLLGCLGIMVDAPLLAVLRTIQGLGGSRKYRNSSVLRTVVYAAAALVLTIGGLTPSRLVMAFVLGDAAALGYGAVALRRTLLTLERRGSGKHSILGRSVRAHFAVLSQQVSYRADIVLLGIFASPREVGQYAVATAIAEALWVLSEAISLSVFATTAKLQATGDTEGIDDTLRKAVKVNLRASLWGGAFVAMVSYPLLSVLLRDYRPAFSLVVLLLPGIAMGGMVRVFSSSAIAAGRAALVRASAIISLVLTPVYVPFILVGSALGAAIASDVIYIGMAVCLLWMTNRYQSIGG